MTQLKSRRMSASVTLGLTALLAASLAGCGGQEEEATHQGVCVDQKTQERISDDKCDTDRDYGYYNGYGWYYIPIGHPYPAYGGAVSGGSFHPSGSVVAAKGGASASGGTVARTTVSRGGFGGSGGGGSRGFGG